MYFGEKKKVLPTIADSNQKLQLLLIFPKDCKWQNVSCRQQHWHGTCQWVQVRPWLLGSRFINWFCRELHDWKLDSSKCAINKDNELTSSRRTSNDCTHLLDDIINKVKIGDKWYLFTKIARLLCNDCGWSSNDSSHHLNVFYVNKIKPGKHLLYINCTKIT